jgi:hypothetical protein
MLQRWCRREFPVAAKESCSSSFRVSGASLQEVEQVEELEPVISANKPWSSFAALVRRQTIAFEFPVSLGRP